MPLNLRGTALRQARTSGFTPASFGSTSSRLILGPAGMCSGLLRLAALGMKRGLPSFFGSLALLNLHESCRL
jgi:hypothetical protein